MKNTLLLLMTPNMSLKKWNDLGQLSRELWYYKELCHTGNMNLIIYSYGRNDELFLNDFPEAKVLTMHSWIPRRIPFRLQNLIYNISSLFIYRKYFSQIALAKTNQFSAARFGLTLKFFYQIPLVVRMGYYYSHFKKVTLAKRLEERFSFKFCDLIVTTSFEASQYIKKTYKISSGKILVICNSIDLKRFKPLNISKEHDVIFVGRLENSKNIELFISVANSINLKTLIIGKGSLAPLVKNAAQNNPLIEWKERVDNIKLPEYYNKSKCYLVLSEYEGNPKALLEAMACGIACIGTKVPGTRECIENAINGVLVEKDPEQIVAQIIRLCKDENQADFLGKNAHQWVHEHNDYVKNIAKEVGSYSMLLNHS